MSDNDRRIRSTYDAVATEYDARLGDELDHKPLDRALLDAFAKLTAAGPIADVGCGPGHVTRYLAQRHPDVRGVDLSPAMIEVARARTPELRFEVGSMLELPAADAAWQGIVALYSIIHLDPDERARAAAQFARTIRAGGHLLVSFHIESEGCPAGSTLHSTEFLDTPVDVDHYFLEPATVTGDLAQAGFEVAAELRREPDPDHEYPSRRCYLLATRGTT